MATAVLSVCSCIMFGVAVGQHMHSVFDGFVAGMALWAVVPYYYRIK